MKHIIIALYLSIATVWASGLTKKKIPAEFTFQVNPAETEVKWIGKKVTGQHDGKVKIKSGNLIMKNGTWARGEIVVDMNSMTVDDIKDPKGNAKLLGHLKNDDFFATDKFKTATLKVNSVTKKSPKYEVKGDLTIKGITKPIVFMADLALSKSGTAVVTADLTVDRTLYGVKYGSGKFFENLGDKTINDNFTLKMKISAKR